MSLTSSPSLVITFNFTEPVSLFVTLRSFLSGSFAFILIKASCTSFLVAYSSNLSCKNSILFSNLFNSFARFPSIANNATIHMATITKNITSAIYLVTFILDVNLSKISILPLSVCIVLYLISLIFCKITNISDVKISIFTKKNRFLVEKNFLYFSIFANMLIIFS